MAPRSRSHGRAAHAGVVSTPPDLARRLARDPTDPRTYVLDPACGDGELLLAALQRAGGDREFAERGLFGIELDPDRARRARERLREAAGLERSDALERHVVCADALDPGLTWPAGTWVLANPPWLSFSGRHASPNRERCPRGVGGWPSLQAAFLGRIAHHIASEGTGATVLLPGSMTELERYGPVRAEVTEHSALAREPEELGERAFEGVTEPAVLVGLRPRAGPGPGSQAPWTTARVEDARLVAALERFPRLPARTFRDPGLHTGNCSRELVLPADRGDWPPLRQGRDLAPYALGPASARLYTALEPGGERRFRIAPREHYESFPVLVRQTANRPRAALHTAPTYFRNSLLAAREVPDLDPAFIVAVLNSPVAAAWHKAMFRDARQRTFPQVKVRHLASQPFPIASRAADARLHDAIVELARAEQPDARAIDRIVLDAYGLPPELESRARELAP